MHRKIILVYWLFVFTCWPCYAEAAILMAIGMAIVKAAAMMALAAVVGAAVSYFTYKPPDVADAASLEQFNVPTTMQGRMKQVVFGSPRVKGYNDLWHGDLESIAITQKVAKYGLLGNHKNEPTGRYKYSMGFHYGFCNACDAVLEIRMDEEVFWSGSAGANTTLVIDKADLFGGTDSQGGISGEMDIMLGRETQAVNDYLQEAIGADKLVPAYRGLVSIVSRRMYIGTSNYMKPMDAIMWRSETDSFGDAIWNKAQATIIGSEGVKGMNPIHIIHEMITDPEYSLTFSNAIDYTSFTQAAQTAYNEGFGLSFVWDNPQAGEQIMEDVMSYIDGHLRVNPTTNEFEIKLMRDDFNVADLPVITGDDLLSVDGPTKLLAADVPNMVQVNYTDPITRKSAVVTARNEALISTHGENPKFVDAPYLLDPDRANEMAYRVLRRVTANPGTSTFKGFRILAQFNKGDVFRLQWPEEGFKDVVLRVMSVDYGSVRNGTVSLTAEEDIYAAPRAVYTTPAGSGWTNTAEAPIDLPYRKVIEAPYFVLAQNVGATVASEMNTETGRVFGGGVASASNSTNLLAMTRVGADDFLYTDSEYTYVPFGILESDIVAGFDNVTVAYSAGSRMALIEATGFEWCQIGGEILKVVSHSPDTRTITLARGCMDTLPAIHGIGSEMHFLSESNMFPSTEYGDATTVDVKFIPSTTLGRLDPADASSEALTMNKRYIRPINGAKFEIAEDGVTEDLTFSWLHRNRLTQVNSIDDQTVTGISAEAGTQYTVSVFDGSTWKRDFTVSGESQVYTRAQRVADFGEDTGVIQDQNAVYKLKATRNGYDSWQTWQRTKNALLSPT